MLTSPYEIRQISITDAALVAFQRFLMFRDMGLLEASEAELLRETSRPWIEAMLRQETYVGWFVQCEGTIVGGGGMHLNTFGPKPGFIEGGKSAHVANVYIHPAHRRLGLANELMKVMLTWARLEAIAEVTLSASDDAKPLYQQLGFVHDRAHHVLKL